MKKHRINPRKQKSVRKLLRNFLTPWEQALCNHLKGRQLDGFKFRRQQGIECYVVDFCYPKVKLIVELD
jgi:very-short-patch-repair endonuclease